tara:strand:- start:135993 stop:137942 length:1950 start_codon:yes stop_codon:yes gene_type:complete
MDDLEQELKVSFLEEAAQLIVETEQAFLDLESSPDDPSLLDSIFRMAHNLKGTSRAVGFGNVAEFTHELESMLLKIKEGELGITTPVVNVLLACNDFLSEIIEKLQDDLDYSFDSSDLIKEIRFVMDGGNPGGKESSRSEAEVAVSGESSEFENDDESTTKEFTERAIDKLEAFDSAHSSDPYGHDPVAQAMKDLEAKEKAKDSQLEAEASKLTKAESGQVEAASSTSTGDSDSVLGGGRRGRSTKASTSDETIRVKLRELEKLNNYVGELVILQTVMTQHRHIIQSDLLVKTVGQLEKLSKEIQSISMGLRMVPIKQTFQKMQRVVRDVSRSLGKKVKLEISGESTEVDKTVLENLGDPLVHIIRNAVDHGLESTSEERVAVGKSEFGHLHLHAFHEGNNLVIEIKDDGKGIDPDVIREKAVQKGLLAPDKKVSAEEAINFIFEPGFSTKQEVSEISGRGVGMDVVKHNIRSLSGDVHVFTEKGKGSTFRVVLPLTLAIIDGMITEVGDHTFVFPISQIHETIKPKKSMVSFVTGVGEVLTLRGEVMPIHSLGRSLKISGCAENVWDGIVVIVRSSEGPYAVMVDEIVRLQQVVIKKLGDEISKKKGMIGSAILGDGLPSVILDLNELYTTQSVKAKAVGHSKNLGVA